MTGREIDAVVAIGSRRQWAAWFGDEHTPTTVINPCPKPIAIQHSSPLVKDGKAAEILDLEVATLRRWRWKGCGPRYLKLGGAVRYELAEIEAFKEASRRASTSDPGPQSAKA